MNLSPKGAEKAADIAAKAMMDRVRVNARCGLSAMHLAIFCYNHSIDIEDFPPDLQEYLKGNQE